MKASLMLPVRNGFRHRLHSRYVRPEQMNRGATMVATIQVLLPIVISAESILAKRPPDQKFQASVARNALSRTRSAISPE
jgi:hypothetical protein